tara:strand:+ start:299 stop:556 length:258 start_codon:yes stop_codon:yes gene_type:complete
MEDDLIEKLIACSDFKSQFSFLQEKEIREVYGDDLFETINKEFSDNWAYELSERLESIDIKALITAAVRKALAPPTNDGENELVK